MSSEISKSDTERLCGLCDVSKSKYCCPRCNVFYCSLNCYKSEKHLQCSESFYKDCINAELESNEIDEEGKQKMIEILKKMQDDPEALEYLDEDVDSDDGSELDLQARLKDLNLDDPDAVWSALTEDEKNEFEALIQQGDVDAIVPRWEPWWMYFKEEKLVDEIIDEKKEIDTNLQRCPALKSVQKFNLLTNVKPSPTISYNISNVLASYAFIMRYYNGDINPTEAATYLIDICCNLNSNTNYEDADIAIEAVKQRCLQSELIETDEASLEIMKNDTFLLLRGPANNNKLFYAKSALSHLIQIFTDTKTKLKSHKIEKNNDKGEFSKKYPDHDNHSLSIDKSKCNKIIKKLEFYLSFLNSCDIIKPE